jgi:hypothetical protein
MSTDIHHIPDFFHRRDSIHYGGAVKEATCLK